MRCPECAADNPPEYRFCGMCGKPLEVPVPVHAGKSAEPAGARRPPTAVSGPSFLGLSDEPSSRGSRDLKYLLDEEDRPRRTYGRFILILLLLAGVGGLGWLEYSRGGKSWVAPWAKESPKTPVQASQPDASQLPAPTAGSEAPVNNAPPAGSSSAGTSSGASSSEPSSKPAESAEDHAAAQDKEKHTTAPDQTAAAKSAPQSETRTEAPAEESTQPEASADADSSDQTPPAKPAKFAKTSKPKAVPPAAAASPDDALVANAEKYLYGRGVPQNCDRALISMRAAAERGNTRARSLMGSMYATGHCVPRDLPNAYRWFALASRTDAENVWVQKNLEMIWREMTPQERQLATQRSQ